MRLLRRGLPALLLPLLAALAGCARPPSTAYLASSGITRPAAQVTIGRNAVGESCTMQATAEGGADVYCGTWQQPSARVRAGGAASGATLATLAIASPWRARIDQRYDCQAPTATTLLDGRPAQLLVCTQRSGGWPHVAVAVLVGERVWYADGVQSATPAMARAIGVRAGLFSADASPPSSAAEALLAQRLAQQAVSSGDIGQFANLMAAGTRANLSDNPAAAEDAFRAALALQRKALGRDNPNTATAVMTLALQLSDEAAFAEAQALFAEAERLAPHAADPTAPARLLHYRGLDAFNQGRTKAALELLQSAGVAYAALIPPGALHGGAGGGGRIAGSAPGSGGFGGAAATLVASQDLLTDPTAQTALVGLIEARRNEALILRNLGRLDDSRAVLQLASGLAQSNGLTRPILEARLYRTGGVTAFAAGDTARALSDLEASSRAFSRSLPDSKPLADASLLRAGGLVRQGRAAEALPLCREAVTALATLKAGSTPALIEPCLDAYGAGTAALAEGAERQTLLAEMFTAAQLAQGGITSQQIAQATARLEENARDPRVAAAIRRLEEARAKLQALHRTRDELAAAAAQPAGAAPAADLTALEAQIKDAQAALAEADAALQAASPNFGQLAQQVVPAAAVLAALRPHEALLDIALGAQDGWGFVLRDGRIAVARLKLGTAAAAKLVAAVRAGIELTDKLPTFDVAAARALYDAALAPVGAQLEGVETLVVAPAGPLLALPFEVLLTGPADPAHLAEAPWLLRRFTLVHVPAPGSFVSLRRVAAGSRATRPWFGFGDFVPVPLALAERSFPGSGCGDSARLLAGLPRLAGASRELDASRRLLGAAPGDALLGPAFTAPAVARAPLKDVRILHFAAHALLPAELRCQGEPAIVTSAPAGAADAGPALLTASAVTHLDLDAELVILSACNSGGGNGGTAGESLSGLARAFFFAGARTLLVTHWEASDQMAAFLVVSTLGRLRADPALGVAAALRQVQLATLEQAGKGLPAEVAHPFFWAPFAVIGEAGGAAKTVAQRASPDAPAGL
jgi:CHAT domain-containing protein/tetratricopeptide (TPR) repeat protein